MAVCHRAMGKQRARTDGKWHKQESRLIDTELTVLLIRVTQIRNRRTRLLDLNQRVHDPRRGSPPGVTVGTTRPRDGNVDIVFARSHAGTLTHDGGRIVVIVATERVY